MLIHELDHPLAVFQLVLRIAAVGCAISSFEWLSLYPHLRDDGVFSWQHQASALSPWLKHRVNEILSYPNVLWMHALRIALCICIFLADSQRIWLGLLSATLGGSSIILSIRGGHGSTGADQMLKILFVASGLSLSSGSPLMMQAGLSFIAAQLCLAYATSGWIRIFEPAWTNGTALATVLRQHNYGNLHAWRLVVRYPRLASSASKLVLLFECSFPLALVFLPPPVFLAYVSFGVLFHTANAVLLGLNIFVWAFVAAYPAALWVNGLLHSG